VVRLKGDYFLISAVIDLPCPGENLRPFEYGNRSIARAGNPKLRKKKQYGQITKFEFPIKTTVKH